MAELAATASAVLEWLADRLIPAGGALCILASFMKVGKSTLLAYLIASVLRGRPFLGFDVKRGGVLLLAVEGRAGDTYRALARFGIRDDEPGLAVHVGYLPDAPQEWKALRENMARTGRRS